MCCPTRSRGTPSQPVAGAGLKGVYFNSCAQVLSLWGDSPPGSIQGVSPTSSLCYIHTLGHTQIAKGLWQRMSITSLFSLAKTSRESCRDDVLMRCLGGAGRSEKQMNVGCQLLTARGSNSRKFFLTGLKAGSLSQVPGQSVSDEYSFPGW